MSELSEIRSSVSPSLARKPSAKIVFLGVSQQLCIYSGRNISNLNESSTDLLFNSVVRGHRNTIILSIWYCMRNSVLLLDLLPSFVTVLLTSQHIALCVAQLDSAAYCLYLFLYSYLICKHTQCCPRVVLLLPGLNCLPCSFEVSFHSQVRVLQQLSHTETVGGVSRSFHWANNTIMVDPRA